MCIIFQKNPIITIEVVLLGHIDDHTPAPDDLKEASQS